MVAESNLEFGAPSVIIGIAGAGTMGTGIAQVAVPADSGPSALPVPDRQSTRE